MNYPAGVTTKDIDDRISWPDHDYWIEVHGSGIWEEVESFRRFEDALDFAESHFVQDTRIRHFDHGWHTDWQI